MSVLRNIEAKLENLVEGVFSRTFKANVEPIELARKLAKEMEENRAVSISRVYVPNEYRVFLSPEDAEHLAPFGKELQGELESYLIEHAQERGFALVTRPSVTFETDERLRLGEFGIQARVVQPPREAAESASQGEAGRTMVYSPDHVRELAGKVDSPSAPDRAFLIVSGQHWLLEGQRVRIGRSSRADLVLDDPNVSREHAELAFIDGTWRIADMGSTNGLEVNGRRTRAVALESGDQITIGESTLTFELE